MDLERLSWGSFLQRGFIAFAPVNVAKATSWLPPFQHISFLSDETNEISTHSASPICGNKIHLFLSFADKGQDTFGGWLLHASTSGAGKHVEQWQRWGHHCQSTHPQPWALEIPSHLIPSHHTPCSILQIGGRTKFLTNSSSVQWFREDVSEIVAPEISSFRRRCYCTIQNQNCGHCWEKVLHDLSHVTFTTTMEVAITVFPVLQMEHQGMNFNQSHLNYPWSNMVTIL